MDKINITEQIKRDNFENMIHIAIIDELKWKEKKGEIKSAHTLSQEICKMLGDKFYAH